MDLVIRNATLPDGRQQIDIGIADGRIAVVAPHLAARGAHEIDAGGDLVSPPFVDAHFHMDAVLSYGLPRVNRSGTLLEGIALWGELKPQLTQDALVERALRYCDWAVARGLLAIRSHVDVCDDRLLAVEALLEVKRRVAPYLDLQLVAFPQDGLLRSPTAFDNLKRAIGMGVDVVGGIPHFERTMAQGAESVRLLCEFAAERGLRVDMHCDESDDPLSRHIETLAHETQRLGLQGRVAGSHLTSMHSMDNYYVSKLLPLIAESGVAAIANLIRNACQYTEQGEVTVLLEPGRLSVEDTGPGLPDAVRQTLDRDAAAIPSSGSAGTGLGLSLVKRICEYLGATLIHEQRAGGGSRFTIVFPDEFTQS